MTFIQPNKKFSITFINAFFTVLVVAVVLSTFWLIALYNTIVNVNHNIAATKTSLNAVGAQSTNLNNQIVAMLGSGPALASAVSSEGLVEDASPQYFQINQQWAFASQP